MNNTKTSFGFTLIELLMVISIITLVSSIFFSYVGSARAKSRDAVRLSDMKQIGTAANLYYEDKGILPDSIGVLVSSGYLSSVPSDPKTGEQYKFYSSPGKAFVAYTSYETQFIEASTTAQKVGVVTGDTNMSDLCKIASSLKEVFPNCTTGSDSNDQIVGVTSGHRRSGGGGEAVGTPVDNISDCSESQIDKSCPNPMVGTPCFCGGKMNNIDISTFLQDQCLRLINYGLYWYDNLNSNGKNCVNESLCVDIYGGQWNSSQTNKCILTESFLCNNNGGKWLDLVGGGGVCLKIDNCDDYSASPYNRYWSYELNSCEQALPKSSYTNKNGCESQGGTWTNYILSSSNNDSNLGSVYMASKNPTPATSTNYRCLITNMGDNKCRASGGSVLSSSYGCFLSCFTNPKGLCPDSVCLPSCIFEAE